MTQESKDKLNAYAEIKSEIKALEEKADILNTNVLEIMEHEEVQEIEIGNYGKLTLASRRTWSYSDLLQEEESSLKLKKKEEEQTGTADYTEKKYVIFKTKKNG